MCGLSKTALLSLGWCIGVVINGMKLFDECGEQIGWFEHYCGSRSDLGNWYHSNQPYMQKWIVQKEKLDKSMWEAGIPQSITQKIRKGRAIIFECKVAASACLESNTKNAVAPIPAFSTIQIENFPLYFF